jgi:Uma2 family endonuclease
MATITRQIGPADQGLRMTLPEFIEADWQGGWLYELAQGVLVVTEVPRPPHALTVERVADMFSYYKRTHPGLIYLRASGAECRIRLIGMQSDRHPDQAIYFTPPPDGPSPWSRWVPAIVVEVVSKGGKQRDYVEKREEYLRFGITEYWILDPLLKRLLVLQRAGDVWEERVIPAGKTYRTDLLPGLIVRPSELLGIATRRGR